MSHSGFLYIGFNARYARHRYTFGSSNSSRWCKWIHNVDEWFTVAGFRFVVQRWWNGMVGWTKMVIDQRTWHLCRRRSVRQSELSDASHQQCHTDICGQHDNFNVPAEFAEIAIEFEHEHVSCVYTVAQSKGKEKPSNVLTEYNQGAGGAGDQETIAAVSSTTGQCRGNQEGSQRWNHEGRKNIQAI